MAGPLASQDLGQFFDFGEATSGTTHELVESVATSEPTRSATYCPAHGTDSTDGCICHGFVGDYELPADIPEQPAEEFSTDFSNYLPRYHKPSHPCDYCRIRSLECFVYNATGDASSGCSPCNALFRPCSFSNPEKMPMRMSKTALDTLDAVDEDGERHFGGLTGKKQMRSLGHVGPIEDELPGERGTKKSAGTVARFPRAAVKLLKDWMIAHIDHPYPTDEEKEMLKSETGLSINQISNWMANTRRRQKARPKRSASPSIRPSTGAIDIPAGRTWDDLNPFERWKHSPPENEPAPLTAIARAVETFDPPETASLSSSYNGRRGNSNDSTGSFSVFRAPSTTSLETGFTQMSSGSHASAYSHGSRNSLGSLNSLNSKKERRRRRRLPVRTPKIDLEGGVRLFQCTFCTDRFKSKYDWSRHEKSLHLSLEKWMCAPLGEIVACTSTGQRKCVYCDEIEPSGEHLAAHNHAACEEKGKDARTFYRKDHLRQHLRLMHGCKMIPSMDTWKSEAQYIKSRCGFCSMKFDKWQDRVDHLAKEFRAGANMKDWKGCRGLDVHVAAHVTNAMPPYLIANEAKSPMPFSATNSSSMKQHTMALNLKDMEYLLPNDASPTQANFPYSTSDSCPSATASTAPFDSPRNSSVTSVSNSNSIYHPRATCWEILTLQLGRYAREHMETHGPNGITDDMLQSEARRILYDCDDPWNQTAADNSEWLALFKQAHGIDTRTALPEVSAQHNVLEDLGLRPTSDLDRSFNINNFECVSNEKRNHQEGSMQEALAYECSLAGSNNVSNALGYLGSGNSPFSMPPIASATTSIANMPAITGSLATSMSELAQTTPPTATLGPDGEINFSDDDQSPQLELNETSMFSMPPLPDIPSATAGTSLQDHFAFNNWDQLPKSFALPTTTAGMASSMPVSMGMNTSGIDSGIIQGSMDDPQIMRWDDSELDFGAMDLDVDLNVNMDMEYPLGGNNSS